jgi:hypothetical protein
LINELKEHFGAEDHLIPVLRDERRGNAAVRVICPESDEAIFYCFVVA